MKTLKYSRHREAILAFLKNRHDHPTAEVIYQNLKTEYPRISLGTVYRNLALLAELGEIQTIACGDMSEHYDGDISEHPHFVCSGCHKIIDLQMDNLGFLNTLAEKSLGGVIDSHQLIFYGRCSECMEGVENADIG